MTRPLRIFINGFGRIGRTVLRQVLLGPNPNDVQVVGINDIAPIETCAYLARYDSVYGPMPTEIETGKDWMKVGAHRLRFTCVPDLRALDLSDVDVVLECTGKAGSRAVAVAGLKAGASNVLISGPSPAADRTIVIGANDEELGDAQIVSNSSCTTNAIAPLLKALDADLGIAQAHVTTIHCYTGSQPTVDQPRASLERSRAAAVSMVPTTTSAAGQVHQVLPTLQDRLSVAAVRVPSLSVSAIDATIQIAHRPDGPFQDYLKSRFAGSNVVGLSMDPCVSTDFRARPESLIIALPETQEIGPHQVRIFGWYDNEWGFSARMLDMARRLVDRPA